MTYLRAWYRHRIANTTAKYIAARGTSAHMAFATSTIRVPARKYQRKAKAISFWASWLIALIILAAPLSATNPRISGGVQIGSGARAYPCQTGAACTANPNYQILYDSKTSVHGCNEIWAMHNDGTSNVNLTALMLSHGWGYGTNSNQGSPVFSNDGLWMMFLAEETHTAACTAHSEDPGSGPNQEIDACDLATLSNCAKLATITPELGIGYLHPNFARVGAGIYAGYVQFFGCVNRPVGICGALVTATFVPGTPPSVANVALNDPNGDGTYTLQFYEPADDGPQINTGPQNAGGPSCLVYYTCLTTTASPTLADVGIAYFNVCDGISTGFVSTPFTPAGSGAYTEFWALTAAHPDMALTTSDGFYTGPSTNTTGLDLVLAGKDSGSAATQLTGFNTANAVLNPEYKAPVIVSDPRWSADGSFLTITVVPGALQPGQTGYAPQIWKYSIDLTPSQSTGTTSLTGKGSIQ